MIRGPDDIMSAVMAPGRISSDDDPPEEPVMPEKAVDTEKLRLAISVFYDFDRLVSALDGFLALGLSADDLWLAGKRQLLDGGSPLDRALTARDGGLASLARSAVSAIGKLPNAMPLWATGSGALRTLRKTRLQNGLSCLESVLSGDVGGVLQSHAEKGAIIAVALTAAPALQDQCVRVLLRHSQHMVHAQEYFPDRAL